MFLTFIIILFYFDIQRKVNGNFIFIKDSQFLISIEKSTLMTSMTVLVYQSWLMHDKI